LKKINGIVFRDGNRIIQTEERSLIKNLDDIPFPARDLLNMKYYLQLKRFVFPDKIGRYGQMLTSRGCPYS